MRILGIETSCDDTGIALVDAQTQKVLRFEVLSHIVSSQIKLHAKYGGVYPSLAKREHEKNLPIVLSQVLRKAQCSTKNLGLDAIAITVGPGLSPCLWTGIHFAKELAIKWNLPLIPVNHIEAHLLIALLAQSSKNPKSPLRQNSSETSKIPSLDSPSRRGGRDPKQIQNSIQSSDWIARSHDRAKFKSQNLKEIFPTIALIVSGGHTQLILVKGIGNYQIIGETRDDAAGECFDKTARILGLSYPGGPAIAREAEKTEQSAINNQQSTIKLPRPMMHTKDYDFSFSGLKTAVLYDYQSRPETERKSKEYIQAMAAEIQQAIVDVLISKTLRAAREYNAKSVILGGGVAANDELRKQLASNLDSYNLTLLAPQASLATDNGAMIALAGYFNFQAGKAIKSWDKLQASPNLRIA